MAHVLIVEDEDDFADLLGFLLNDLGHDIVKARNGTRALEEARERKFDLVILDILLPEIDGISICEILRRYPETRKTPVMMLTSFSSEDTISLSMSHGADDFLSKAQFSPREFMSRVNRLLLNRPATAASEVVVHGSLNH